MNKRADQLYQTMLQDMEHCRRKQLGRSAELECLFNTCNSYWAILQSEVATHQFASEAEEIRFFKVIKPKFIAEKICCGLKVHAQLFKESTHDPIALEKFWRNECKRLEKFKATNTFFCEHFRSGQTDKDHEWFTRQYGNTSKDLEVRASSLQDHLVSQLMGLEMYMQFVETELETISR